MVASRFNMALDAGASKPDMRLDANVSRSNMGLGADASRSNVGLGTCKNIDIYNTKDNIFNIITFDYSRNNNIHNVFNSKNIDNTNNNFFYIKLWIIIKIIIL